MKGSFSSQKKDRFYWFFYRFFYWVFPYEIHPFNKSFWVFPCRNVFPSGGPVTLLGFTGFRSMRKSVESIRAVNRKTIIWVIVSKFSGFTVFLYWVSTQSTKASPDWNNAICFDGIIVTLRRRWFWILKKRSISSYRSTFYVSIGNHEKTDFTETCCFWVFPIDRVVNFYFLVTEFRWFITYMVGGRSGAARGGWKKKSNTEKPLPTPFTKKKRTATKKKKEPKTTANGEIWPKKTDQDLNL